MQLFSNCVRGVALTMNCHDDRWDACGGAGAGLQNREGESCGGVGSICTHVAMLDRKLSHMYSFHSLWHNILRDSDRLLARLSADALVPRYPLHWELNDGRDFPSKLKEHINNEVYHAA